MITRESIKAVIAQRLAAHGSLDAWARLNGFEPAAHHRLINSHLEAVDRGDIRKLMILLPPGSAKSTYASVLFPPWYLNRASGRTVLACSYAYTLIENFARRARNLVEQNSTKSKNLSYALRADARAAGDWETTNGGRYFCAGVGAGIAGHRADIGIIDDPIGSREDADSDSQRQKAWDWYLFDFKPRLKPNAAQVIIMTPWHVDDLRGRLLNSSESEGWHTLRVPFFCDSADDPLGRSIGDMLWPEWFKPEMFSKDARVANALYQCSPVAECGNFFDRDSIRPYQRDELPPERELSIFVASDHALGTKEHNDFTCMVPCGVDADGTIWVLPDIVWSKMDTKVAVDRMFEMIKRRAPIYWWAGKDHIESSIGPFLRDRMRNEHVWSCLVPVAPGRRDKRSRAQSINGLMREGRVRFPTFATWWPQAHAELMAFDAGVHDDFVDCLALLGLGISSMRRGSRVVPAPQRSLFGGRLTYARVLETDEHERRRQRQALYTY